MIQPEEQKMEELVKRQFGVTLAGLDKELPGIVNVLRRVYHDGYRQGYEDSREEDPDHTGDIGKL